MDELTQKLARLSSAEDFLNFFALPFDAAVVDVSRLHILKRFYQYLRRDTEISGLDEGALYARYRKLLAQAYQDFVSSTPAQEKVFRVFQDAEGRHISIESLKATLPSARGTPP